MLLAVRDTIGCWLRVAVVCVTGVVTSEIGRCGVAMVGKISDEDPLVSAICWSTLKKLQVQTLVHGDARKRTHARAVLCAHSQTLCGV